MRRAAYSAGMMLRESGQALDRVGCSLQGSYAYKEQLSRNRQIMNLLDRKPIIGTDVFIAPSASIIGEVQLLPSSSVFYGCVLRGDHSSITVGEGANIQDRAVIHTTRGLHAKNEITNVTIGALATICQGASIHAANIHAEAYIGVGAVISPGASIGKHAMVAAGGYVPPGTTVKEGELWAGAPASFVRMLEKGEVEEIVENAKTFMTLAQAHAQENGKTPDQIEGEIIRQQLMDERSDDYHSHLGLTGREAEIVEIQANIIEEDRVEHAKIGERK